MLTMLLPISIVPMKRSRIGKQAVDDAGRAASPPFSSASMREREAPRERRLAGREEGGERGAQNTTIAAAAHRSIDEDRSVMVVDRSGGDFVRQEGAHVLDARRRAR